LVFGDSNFFTNNIFSNNYHGFYLNNVDFSNFSNSIFSNNTFDIYLNIGSNNNVFYGNSLNASKISGTQIASQQWYYNNSGVYVGNLWLSFVCSNSNNYTSIVNNYLYTMCSDDDFISGSIQDLGPLFFLGQFQAPSISITSFTANTGTILQNWTLINLTTNVPLSSCTLEWNNVNESIINIVGNNCYINKTDSLGTYSFKVFFTGTNAANGVTSLQNVVFSNTSSSTNTSQQTLFPATSFLSNIFSLFLLVIYFLFN
jgi:hypothetical protein